MKQAISRYFFFVGCMGIYIVLAIIIYASTPLRTSCFDIDSTGYDRIGLHFAQTGCLQDPLDPCNAPVQTIGYHFFLGILYSLFGHSYAAVIAAQIMCIVAALWFLFCTALRLWGDGAGRWVLLLSLCNIGFVVYPQFLLAESVLVLFVAVFLERLSLFYTTKSVLALITAGLVLGISLVVKPALFLFGMWCCFFIMLRRWQTIQRRFMATILFAIAMGCPLIMYMARNKVQYGFFATAPMASLNIYHVFLTKIIAEQEHISLSQAEQMIPRFNARNSLDDTGWNGAKTLFYRYVTTYPLIGIKVWFKNVLKSTIGLYATQLKLLMNPSIQGGDVSFFTCTGSLWQRVYNYIVEGADHAWVVIIAFFEVVITLLRWCCVGYGLWCLAQQRSYFLLLFFVVFIINGLIITGFDGCGRYRMVVEPVLLLLAAYGMTRIFLRNSARVRVECV